MAMIRESGLRRAAILLRLILVLAGCGLFSVRTFAAGTTISAPAFEQMTQGVEPTASVATPQELFEFRSGFWINLHHFLYLQAVLATPEARKGQAEESARGALPGPAMSAAQKAVWDGAVRFYLQYGKRDALTDNELVKVNYELSDAGNSPNLKGRQLSPELMATLEEAASVYRALWWSEHDRRNRAWIAEAAKLVSEYGPSMSQRIATAFHTEWPKEKTATEVVVYANWAGAYTVTNSTLITISSADSAGQGEAGLETLFHEASHALIGNVQRQLSSDLLADSKTPNFGIVHVITFYTAGVVTADALAKNGVHDFVAYAVKNGLYERVPDWKHYREVCDNDWRPYLNGKVTFDEALKQVAKDF
jgi:hypothetical protein